MHLSGSDRCQARLNLLAQVVWGGGERLAEVCWGWSEFRDVAEHA